MKSIVDQHGRPWGQLDEAIARAAIHLKGRNFAVLSEDGAPLFGACGHPGESVTYRAIGWKSQGEV